MTNYERDGYQLVRQAIPREDLEPFRSRIMQAVDEHAARLRDEGKVSDTYEQKPFARRFAAVHANTELRLRSWDGPVFSPELHSFIFHPGISDALEPHLGSNVSFNGDYHLRPKMPKSEDTAFPFHNDSQYYGRPSRSAHIITVWIPLVDVDEENGCVHVIPRSQQWEFIESARDDNENMRSFEDVEKRGTPIPVPMTTGDILLLSNKTFHGSKVNQSESVRWSIDIRYCRTRHTFEATAEEREGEEFMYHKLRK